MASYDDALTHIDAGMPVFPIRFTTDGVPKPQNNFSTDATLDKLMAQRFWRTGKQQIGVATGRELRPNEYLMVLDIDGETGNQSLIRLTHNTTGLPATYTVKTPSSDLSCHFYLTTPYPVANSVSQLADNVDVRGHNGFVVGHGSERLNTAKPDGPYAQISLEPITHIAPCPDWLLSQLTKADISAVDSGPHPVDAPVEIPIPTNTPETSNPNTSIVSGTRNATLFSDACALRERGAGRSAIAAYLAVRNVESGAQLPDGELNTLVNQACKYSPGTPADQNIASAIDPNHILGDVDSPAFDVFEFNFASHLPIEHVDFLFDRWFPRRMVTTFVGKGGLGKTTALMAIAAALSRGHAPAPTLAPPEHPLATIYITAEDSITSGVLPRYQAAGGVPGFLSATQRRFDVVKDMEHILHQVDAHHQRGQHVGLIVLDPATSCLADGADNNATHDVQRMLNRLHSLAERADCAVIAVTHQKKSASNASESVLGSVAWVNNVRSVYHLVPDPDMELGTVIVPEKVNVEPPEAPLRCVRRVLDVVGQRRVRSTDPREGHVMIDQPLMAPYSEVSVYDGELGFDELLAAPFKKDKRASVGDQCRFWLLDFLRDGEWVLREDILRAADVAGFSERSIRSASQVLVRHEQLVKEQPDGKRAFWRLGREIEGEAVQGEGASSSIGGEASSSSSEDSSSSIGGEASSFEGEASSFQPASPSANVPANVPASDHSEVGLRVKAFVAFVEESGPAGVSGADLTGRFGWSRKALRRVVDRALGEGLTKAHGANKNRRYYTPETAPF